MKIKFYLPLKENCLKPIKLINGMKPLEINNVFIKFCDDDGTLKSITLEFSNQKITYDDKGAIITHIPEIKDKAYDLLLYISNVIFLETGIQCFDSSSIFSVNPVFEGETDEEQAIINKAHFAVSSFCDLCRIIYNPNFDVQLLLKHTSNISAISNFVEGQHETNPQHKYQQFYKVIEYFFPFQGDSFDTKVSAYISQYNSSYTKSLITTLRHLRNRCIHSSHTNNHIFSGKHASIIELNQYMSTIEGIAHLLISNPPN